MSKNRRLWDTASRLLSDSRYFDSERNKTLDSHPLLNSRGLGYPSRSRRGQMICKLEELANLEENEIRAFIEARDSLRMGGRCEQGIRNTLEYFVNGRISLSYRLRGCIQPKRFNGPAPPKQSSYSLKQSVESYLRDQDRRRSTVEEDQKTNWHTANGAFICASLMVGLKIWTYKGSINPDLRIGKPWAVAGLQPEDYVRSSEEDMARFWRWVVQLDQDDPKIEEFISDTIDLLYSGVSLERLQFTILRADESVRTIYEDLLSEFRVEPGRTVTDDPEMLKRIGFLFGEIDVPDDFNEMARDEIAEMFGIEK